MPTPTDALDGPDADRVPVPDAGGSRPRSAPRAPTPCAARLIEDVSRASAAHVWGEIRALAALPPGEGFERLVDRFRAAFLAYADGLAGWHDTPG